MASDSDDDFERFLQESNSASVSSASPVKRRVANETTSKKKPSAAAARATNARATSGSNKAVGRSSLSAVAAAEKLLAASGRASGKRQAVVDEGDDDDDEPPPSYSDDPYAFELDDAASRYARKSADGDDDSDGASSYRKSARRDSKAKYGKSDRDDASAKAKKSKGKSKEKEPPSAPKGEAKPARTLEDRIADILKRTGSSTYPSGAVVASENKDAEGDDDDGDAYSDEDDNTESKSEATTQRTIPSNATKATARSSRELSASAERKANESDDNSESHRLSFSDSLGMESADFEVGALAKRKLERSRLSLSSLNSEKFAVNLDALDESEHVSQNRYDDHHADFGPSIGTSEPADSDYDEEGFELDQTTDGGIEKDQTSDHRRSPLGGGADRSFVSQFENMKSLFSLESPVKPLNLTVQIEREEHPSTSANVQIGTAQELDNFGYDDEDFELEEAAPLVDQNSRAISESNVGHQPDEPDEYGDEGFDDSVEPSAIEKTDVELPRNDSHSENRIEHSPTGDGASALELPPVPMSFKFEVISTVVSVTETRSTPANTTEEMTVAVITESPSPPQRGPPPPPPDDPPPPPPIDDSEEKQNPPSPVPRTSPVSIPHAPTSSVTRQVTRQVDRSLDRFREIESQVSSLRFVDDSSRLDRSRATRLPVPQNDLGPAPIVDDPRVLNEIKEIEELVEQAKRVQRERRKSASMRSSVKENELALRLQQAQRQLLQFRQHVQELAEDDTEIPAPLAEGHSARASHESSQSSDLKRDAPQMRSTDDKKRQKEYDELKKEMQSQERLIQGFQRENEQLMKQLKLMQRDLHYDVHKENESLRLQLKELRGRLDGAPHLVGVPDGVDGKLQYRAAIEARLQAEAHADSLQDELKVQARRHQDRVNEMKIELEKVKKAKIDLECRYEGINVEKMEAESRQIRVLKEQLQTQKAEHEHVVAALQKKIDWYVRNQRLLDEQDDKMRELKEENERLKAEQGATPTDKSRASATLRSPRTPARGSARLPADVRRIQELESRLSEMEEAMRRRHPDSLVSLIVSSRKADDESKLNELTQKHGAQVEELTEEMEKMQVNHEKKLNAFRQQQEKLVLQYQKQIGDLERQLANKENRRGGASVPAQSKSQKNVTSANEDELYRVRRLYAEKIKEVERKWEAKYRTVKKQHYAANGPATDNTGREFGEKSPSDAARIIRSLQQEIASKEEESRRLRSGSQSTGLWEIGDLRRRISSLETQLKTSEDARRHLIETISSLSTLAPAAFASEIRSQKSGDEGTITTSRELELEARLVAAKKEHEQSLEKYGAEIKTLQQQVAEESHARHQLMSQIAGHIKEVERLQKMLTEAEQEKRRLQHSAEMATALESEVEVLRDQLSVPQTPSMLQFRSLELRIETLTQKHQLREAELKMLLAQATQSTQLEKLNFERMYRNAIALKNAEINKFKKQLGEILDELEALRRAQPSPSSSTYSH